MKNIIHHSATLRFSERIDCLRIFITKEGRTELKENQINNPKDKSDLDLFVDLMEHHLCNGWVIVWAEKVGDLRDDSWLVISRDYFYESPDNDDAMIVGTAFSFTQYWRDSYLKDLLKNGYVDWAVHNYLTPAEMQEALTVYRPELI